MLHQKSRGRKKKKKRKKRKLSKGSAPRFLPARAVRTRKSGHPSCGSSWCSVSGCCLTSPGLLDYWETTFSMFPYSTLSLVRFWIHARASVYASFGTAPCFWQSLVRLCLRSTVSPFFWEMASGFAVFSASWFDSGYMYCQSTRARIFSRISTRVYSVPAVDSRPALRGFVVVQRPIPMVLLFSRP